MKKTDYFYEYRANVTAVVNSIGTLSVKKYVILENGKLDLVGSRYNKAKKEPSKRYIAKVIYGFNPLDGTYEHVETFIGRNYIRDATRCLIRHHKLILKII